MQGFPSLLTSSFWQCIVIIRKPEQPKKNGYAGMTLKLNFNEGRNVAGTIKTDGGKVTYFLAGFQRKAGVWNIKR